MQNQNSWKVEDTLFPVKEVPAIWNNEVAQVAKTGYKFIVREDTGDVISCVTDDYKLVTNESLFNSTDKIANKLGGTSN